MTKHILITFFSAMLPVLELRFAIPYGVIHDLHPLVAALIAFAGNCIPVPFIILFVRRVFAFMKKVSPRLGQFAERMEARALKKSDAMTRGILIGLFLFIAIPLPGTGAWTGSLIAAMLNLRLKVALPVVYAGVAAMAILTTGVTFGFASLIN